MNRDTSFVATMSGRATCKMAGSLVPTFNDSAGIEFAESCVRAFVDFVRELFRERELRGGGGRGPVEVARVFRATITLIIA